MKNKKIKKNKKNISNINRIKKSKYFISGIVVGLGLLSFGTYAATMGAGTIGSLFKEISGSYFLMGSKIENGTVSLNKLESNSVDTTKIVNRTILEEDLADNSISTTKIVNRTILEEDLNVPLQTKINDKGNNTANYITKANPLGDGFNDSDIYQNGLLIGIGTVNPTAKLEVNGNIISALPTANGHVANKEYVDNLLAGGGGGGGGDSIGNMQGTYFTSGGKPYYCSRNVLDMYGKVSVYSNSSANNKVCGTNSICISGTCTSTARVEYVSRPEVGDIDGYYPVHNSRHIYVGDVRDYCLQKFGMNSTKLITNYVTTQSSYYAYKYDGTNWNGPTSPAYPYADSITCSEKF